MKKTGDFFVYIVRCKDGTLYTGYTNRLDNRIRLHNSGRGAKYTRSRGPVLLAYCRHYRYLRTALRAEMSIKAMTRKEKESLIKLHEKNK